MPFCRENGKGRKKNMAANNDQSALDAQAERVDNLIRFGRINALVSQLAYENKRNPRDVAFVLQEIHDHPDFMNRFGLACGLAPQVSSADVFDHLRMWQALCHGLFGIDLNLSNLQRPKHFPRNFLNFILRIKLF